MKKKAIMTFTILVLIAITTMFLALKIIGSSLGKNQSECLLDRPEFWGNVTEVIFYDFDENIYRTSDNEKLEMVQEVLTEMRYSEIENPWIEGWYLFEIQTNEEIYALGITSNIISFDGKFYKVTDSIGEEISSLMREN